MELDQEKFDYQQTLSNLGVEITKARAVLNDLTNKQADFLSHQESLATQRVQNILDASQDALHIATKNQDLLLSWQADLVHYAEILTTLSTDLDAKTSQFAAKVDGIYTQIDANLANINQKYGEIKVQNSILESQKQVIETEKVRLRDLQAKITSQQITLELAFKELEQKRKANR